MLYPGDGVSALVEEFPFWRALLRLLVIFPSSCQRQAHQDAAHTMQNLSECCNLSCSKVATYMRSSLREDQVVSDICTQEIGHEESLQD